ncbi:MAG: tetratricopeptide repeat protein [Planctomycetia bacterium]|nr:tetratricopeptide repeat protein [Planctomycetia bacterium]
MPGAAPAAASAQQAARRPADSFDDAPAPLVERKPRSQQDKDHLEALSLFAAGRIEEQNEHLREALRLYQRALRFEPNSLPVIRQIIPLAFSLDRPNEAVRYALKAAELDPSDPLLLRQLGLHLAEAGQFEQALKLYQQARSRLEGNTKSASYLMLTMELGRLCFVTDHPREAADAFAVVMGALDRLDDYGLSDSQRKTFVGEEGRKNLNLFAETFLAAGRPDDALTAYDKLDAMRPNKALHAYQLARVSHQKKESQKALEQLQTYFDERGTIGGGAPYELLVKLLGETGQQGKIVERLDAIATAEPKNMPVRRVLATAALAAGDLDKAESLFKALLKEEPDEDVYQGLIKLYRQQKRYPELIKMLGDAVADGDAFDLVEDQVKDIAKDEKVVDSLAEAARKLVADKPGDLDYGDQTAMALLALQAKRFDLAAEFFELALKAKRDSAESLLETWGVGLLLAEQYDEAAKVFQRGIDDHPAAESSTTFHYYLATALAMAERTDEAIAVLRKAIAIPDAPPRLHARLAWVLYHAKRYEEAEKAYRDFLERFDSQYQSEELRVLLRDARLVLSNICVIQDRVPQAEEWLDQVLDEYPENVSAQNDLGYLWAEQGKNLDRALRMIQGAVAADPDNAAYRDSLGWVYYQFGRYEEAVEQLKKAVAGDDEPDGVILDHLGDAYQKLGQADAAREAREQAIRAFEREKDEPKAAKTRHKLEQAGE